MNRKEKANVVKVFIRSVFNKKLSVRAHECTSWQHFVVRQQFFSCDVDYCCHLKSQEEEEDLFGCAVFFLCVKPHFLTSKFAGGGGIGGGMVNIALDEYTLNDMKSNKNASCDMTVRGHHRNTVSDNYGRRYTVGPRHNDLYGTGYIRSLKRGTVIMKLHKLCFVIII